MNIIYKKDITSKELSNNKYTILNIYKNDEDKVIKKNYINLKIDEENYNNRRFIKLIRQLTIFANKEKVKNLIIYIKDINNIFVDNIIDNNNNETLCDNIWKYKVLIENILLANYQFLKYKSDKKLANSLESVIIVGILTKKELEEMKIGEIIGESANITRDLANTPANDMTPTILSNFSKKLFKNSKVRTKILTESDAKKLGMGLFLAVGNGSVEESKFIICEYMNGNKNERPVVLIGKGITFDTGGLNLKPSGMEEMIMDMSGGATVLSVMNAINKIGIKKNIIAIVPAVENAISGSAYRPGDVIKSMSGITVEIGNTDAEGRLVLADAITYSKRYNPRVIIDVATLTGSCVVALGEHASGLMTQDNNLERLIRNISELTGELVWPLPLWDEYKDYMKSNNADINNVGKIKYGGAITAGIFLKRFADDIEDCSWVHIDMAPRMTPAKGDNLEDGATGEPSKLLIELMRSI